MAWYAKIIDNTVDIVTYLVDTKDSDYLHREYGGEWLKCSETNDIRNIFPSSGYIYDRTNDVFYAPQPFPSWVLNETSWTWEAPLSCPNDGKRYTWDEPTQSWIEVTNG
jgi:hypothetical protein